MSTIITPPNFDNLDGIGVPTPPPRQSAFYAPPENTARAEHAAALEALRREVIINRELLRRIGDMSKGQLHEAVEAVRKELFEPAAPDQEAILRQVAQMIEAHTQRLIPRLEETIIQVVQHANRMQPPEQEQADAWEDDTPEPTGPVEIPDKPTLQPALSSKDRPNRPQKARK